MSKIVACLLCFCIKMMGVGKRKCANRELVKGSNAARTGPRYVINLKGTLWR